MKYSENECTPKGMRIYCGEVTSRYKKNCPSVSVSLLGIGDGLVTAICAELLIFKKSWHGDVFPNFKLMKRIFIYLQVPIVVAV
jgi:hypothetical protein